MQSSQSPRKVFPKAVVLHSRVFMSQNDEGSTLFVSFIMLHTLFPSFLSVYGISAFVSRDMIVRTPLTTADRGDARGLSPSPRFSPSEPHRSSRPGSTSSSEGGHSSTSKHIFMFSGKYTEIGEMWAEKQKHSIQLSSTKQL